MTDALSQLEADRRSVDEAYRAAIAAQKASTKAAEARRVAPIGRRKANATLTARWMSKAEERDRSFDVLSKKLREALSTVKPGGLP